MRAIRFSPLDAMIYIPQGVIGFGDFLLGRHEGAVAAVRRAVQLNPGFSILYGWLSAPLKKLGQLDEAKVAGAQLLALDPGFGYLRRNADRSKSAGDGEPTPCGLPASA